MTLLFRITLIVCALLVFIYVLRKIRHSEVKIADSTFWFIFALVILLLAVFPHIAFFFSNIFPKSPIGSLPSLVLADSMSFFLIS